MPRKKLRLGNAKGEIPPVPPPPDKQAAINELVYKHGLNLRNQDQPRIEALQEVGLDHTTITDLNWDRAEIAFKARVEAETNGKRINWPLTPTEKDWGTCKVSEWTSTCGRYNLVRLNREPKPGEFQFEYGAEFGKAGKRESVEHDKKLGPGYATYYPTLRDAANAVIRKHLKEFKLTEVKGNTDEMIECEPKFRSKCLPTDESSAIMSVSESPEHETPTQPSAEGEVPTMPAVKEAPATVIVKEAQVRKMFAAMGMPEDGWSVKTLQKKLSDKEKFAGYASTGKTPDEGTKERITFDKIMEGFSDGIPVEVVPSPAKEGEENGHTEPKAKKGKDKPAKEPKEKKEGVGRDKFGSRLGSQAAAINAAITGKVKSIEQICTDSGQANTRVRSHLKWMEEQGHVVKGDKGYSLKK